MDLTPVRTADAVADIAQAAGLIPAGRHRWADPDITVTLTIPAFRITVYVQPPDETAPYYVVTHDYETPAAVVAATISTGRAVLALHRSAAEVDA
jgi:hypothetical protein